MFTRTAVYVICKVCGLPASSQVSFRFSKSRSAFSRGCDRLDLSSLPALAFVFVCVCCISLTCLYDSIAYAIIQVFSPLFFINSIMHNI